MYKRKPYRKPLEQFVTPEMVRKVFKVKNVIERMQEEYRKALKGGKI